MLDMLMLPIVQLAVLLLLVAVFAALCVWVVRGVLDAFKAPVEEPRQKLINELGRVLLPLSQAEQGKVLVFGEIWDALPVALMEGECIEKDTEVRVVGFDCVDPRVLRVSRQLSPP